MYRLAFYGDDFTGSTDVMEALTLGGVPTVLFLDPPTEAQLAEFSEARAVGIAGTSRAMTPEQMTEHLPKMFAALKALDADFVHYKLCSTFDSSPRLGSIGRALELGLEQFPQALVPLVVGAPVLKRYVAFGNLFATADGTTHRLDRHPTMSKHPATPMSESDLRRHLAKQTDLETDLVDVLALEQGVETSLEQIHASQAKVILFDTLNDAHLATLGELLVRLQSEEIKFVAGSSGLEYALTRYWQGAGEVSAVKPETSVGAVERLLVVSGSAAPATAEQIEYAEAQGFAGIRIDVPRLLDPGSRNEEFTRLIDEATQALKTVSVLLYSAKGPDDPTLKATREALSASGRDPSAVASLLGSEQGRLLKTLLTQTDLTRACVAGGDTCGYAAQALGLYALELLMPVAPGSPLCTAHAQEARFDGLELSLKAGQVGKPDYFLSTKNGTI